MLPSNRWERRDSIRSLWQPIFFRNLVQLRLFLKNSPGRSSMQILTALHLKRGNSCAIEKMNAFLASVARGEDLFIRKGIRNTSMYFLTSFALEPGCDRAVCQRICRAP